MASILKVDDIQSTSAGGVTFSTRPAFSTYLSVNGTTADYTSVTAIPFDEEDFDIGNNLAISNNAVFTAPVAGVYQFNLSLLLGNCQSAASCTTALYIDNATVDGDLDLTYRVLHDPQGGAFQAFTSAHLIQLSVSQTVTPYFTVETDTTTQPRQGTRFSGFLVG